MTTFVCQILFGLILKNFLAGRRCRGVFLREHLGIVQILNCFWQAFKFG